MKIHGTAKGGTVGKKDFGVAFSSGGGSTFTPTDIDDLYVWYDATDSDTITESGNRVSKWENKQGESTRDLVQATSGNQPLYDSSGSSDSGNAVINTTDDRYMETSSALTAITQPLSIIAITKFPPNGVGTAQYLFDAHSGGSDRFVFSKNTGDANDRYTMYAGSDFTESNVSGANAWNYVTLLYNGASSAMRFNASEIDTGSVGSDDLAPILLGARGAGTPVYFWNNEIMHFLIYDKLLSSDDIENIETWAETQMNG